jgi:hypothetical protein
MDLVNPTHYVLEVALDLCDACQGPLLFWSKMKVMGDISDVYAGSLTIPMVSAVIHSQTMAAV